MMITTLDQHVSVLFHAQFRLITTDFFSLIEQKEEKKTKQERENVTSLLNTTEKFI